MFAPLCCGPTAYFFRESSRAAVLGSVDRLASGGACCTVPVLMRLAGAGAAALFKGWSSSMSLIKRAFSIDANLLYSSRLVKALMTDTTCGDEVLVSSLEKPGSGSCCLSDLFESVLSSEFEVLAKQLATIRRARSRSAFGLLSRGPSGAEIVASTWPAIERL